MKPTHLYFCLMLLGSLLLGMIPAAGGFIALEHEWGGRVASMIDKVHQPHWDIAYRYGDDCPPKKRKNDQALTAAVTEALQMWLQPLRDYAKRPIVDDFRYHLDGERQDNDFQITFHCERGVSRASPGHRPRIILHHGTEVISEFMPALVHEVGHIFGLADTYLFPQDWGNPALDKGGRDGTKGTQPDSIMSGLSRFHKDGGCLGPRRQARHRLALQGDL